MDYTKVTNTVAELARDVIDPQVLPVMEDMAMPEDTNSYMTKRLREGKNSIGKTVKIDGKFMTDMPAITGLNYGFRSISEGGATPTGGKIKTDRMTVGFGHFIGAVNFTDRELEAAASSESLISNLLQRKYNGLQQSLPYYIRAMIWNGQSGVQGVVGSISGDTLTLSFTGMNMSNILDVTRYLEEDMIIQIMNSAGTVKRGEPVKIIDVDKLGADIILEAMPAGVIATDIFVFTDSTGAENDFGNGVQGIFDVIDDSNTFQGIDRSAVGNRKWRANMVDNGGAVLSRRTLKDFFKMCHNPKEAICSLEVLDTYFENNIQDKVRYQGVQESYKDDFQYLQFGNTKLFEDEECHSDKIIVPDFDNMCLRTTPLEDVNGVQKVPGWMIWEKLTKFNMQLVGRKASKMGILSNFS